MYKYTVAVTRNGDGEILFYKEKKMDNNYPDLTEPELLEIESFIDEAILEASRSFSIKYDLRTGSLMGINILVEVKEETKH